MENLVNTSNTQKRDDSLTSKLTLKKLWNLVETSTHRVQSPEMMFVGSLYPMNRQITSTHLRPLREGDENFASLVKVAEMPVNVFFGQLCRVVRRMCCSQIGNPTPKSALVHDVAGEKEM